MRSLFGTHWEELERLEFSQETWWHNWIFDKGSLTKSIQQCCKGLFSVEVLTHHFESVADFASAELDISCGETVLHREVLLCDEQEPLVFACSLLPERALCGRYDELRELGTRPLGHWIFTEPVLTRHKMTYTRLMAEDTLFNRIHNDYAFSGALFGRKTLFTGALKPFLVSEFFLPGLQSRIRYDPTALYTPDSKQSPLPTGS